MIGSAIDMMIRDEVDLKRLSGVLNSEINSGTDKVLTDPGSLSDTLSKTQAYRLYGKANVDRWCRENLIHPVALGGSGKKKFIDRLKLEAVARADKRNTFLQDAEL